MNAKTMYFVIGLVLIVGFTLFAWLWLFNQSEKSVFGSLDERQQQSVIEYLGANGIEFYLDAEKGIMVAEELVYPLRMELIEKGIVQPERVGFEVFTETDYGMTEFAQKVNYQRALQGELEKTIIAIQGVKQARVHIKLPRKSVLFAEQQQASAAVVLHLQPGYELVANQILGIQKLVSGAVDSLSLDNVSVVDQSGVVLSSVEQDSINSLGSNTSQYEGRLEKRAKRLLTKWFDASQVEVSVSIELNRVKHSKKIESFPSDKPSVVRRKKEFQKTEPTKGKSAKTDRDIEVEYMNTREMETIEFAHGNVSRMSIGVIIQQNLSEKDIDDIKRLIAASLGADLKRGDVIEVLSVVYAGQSLDIVEENFEPARPVVIGSDDSSYKKVIMLLALVVAVCLVLLVILMIKVKKLGGSQWSKREKEKIREELNAWMAQS
ncbi:flagellar basal-body MS-ring/collar protein FliF [Pleionea sp. CnH1-48]|uniref:flagellar basal-body MS-ring/collar protein FliF n=1 Tax=Pleionea sp. CnH1-48 TaxID=2954494 RepID=UPI002097B87C|nr:flagellar basal-body MS-ring/collar protein FliF [Pleionea sp. CnH1-48]MCO7223713.1 flagellar M-ring protein FliF [Pleionea sp. CnH1-48]